MPSAFLPSEAGLLATTAGAAISLVFGDLATQVGTGLDAVTFDAVVQESFSSTSTVTKHPVETGAHIADHIQDQPDELQIEGILSNVPVMMLASLRVSSLRAEEEYEKLLALKEKKEPMTVYTSRREYEDYVITRIQRTRTPDLGDSVKVSLGLERVIFAQSKSAAIQSTRPAGVQKAKTNAGRAAKKAADAAKSQSLLTKIVSFFAG